MARLGVSLNEVLRDFIGQLTHTYNKYIAETNIKEGDVTNFNLIEFFKFDNVNQLNSFIYLEAAQEIFAHADQLSDGLMTHFNKFLMDIKDDGEHEIEIVSREVNKAIPSTFFFLSKTACIADRYRFVTKHEEEWDGIDILITANPNALLNKPNGKISVKVNASYNKDIPSDYEIDSILDFINNEELRDKIINTKITLYEEL
jgi:hypothetical protein